MPYKVVKRGSGSRPWKIINTDKDSIVGSSETKEKAEASIRARYSAKSRSSVRGFRRKRK